MSSEIKSGREILKNFFENIKNLKKVDKDTIKVVLKLFSTGKLTNTNLLNELEKVREKQRNG